MSFSKLLISQKPIDIQEYYRNIDVVDIDAILNKRKINFDDFLTLLSKSTSGCLEQMAKRAQVIARKQFGHAITLFTPMYISNFCQNRCPYCSFAQEHSIKRKQLTFDEIRKESEKIAQDGMRHILVLTGEAPKITDFEYVYKSLKIISEYFSSVAIEIYPMTEREYGILVTDGCIDGLTIYQETYNEKLYRSLHTGGPKADFEYRIDTPDRACKQGIRAITLGALLGLDDYRREAYYTAKHIIYLQNTYPDIEISVSFPRIRPQAGEFNPRFPVTDRELVQIITAFRIMFPTIGITLSTREPEQFRNGVIPLGITKVSAGVSTAVGGHSNNPSTTQFEIADTRSVCEMKESLLNIGFQPVMHDWNMSMSN